MRSHRSSPRSSLHTSLVNPTTPVNPPHTTSPGRVFSHPFAPSRDARHTPVSRHAPTTPLCSATMPHSSGRAKTQLAIPLAAARVVGAICLEEEESGRSCARA
jgi:hypothetical protein